jgi:YidC/Oxa1 family membrane protein insertase
MNDQKNVLLAIVLSAIVLIAWQIFFGLPQMESQKKKTAQQQTEETKKDTTPPLPGQPTGPGQVLTREAALAASPRVRIETPSVVGSVSLKGGRIDDLSLIKYRETVNPKSPAIVLLSPSGSPSPFYAEFGWLAAAGSDVVVPGPDTLWRQAGSGPLTDRRPLTLVYDNGEGLEFRRTIAVDTNYLFTIKDEVSNKGTTAISLSPFALISRHGTPKLEGFTMILHEGLIGMLGEHGLQEVTYATIADKKKLQFTTTNAWLGITDKYWAATLMPEQGEKLQVHFSSHDLGQIKTYQTDYLQDTRTVAPGSTATVDTRLFAGAKETSVVDAYDQALKLNRFELLIDWGWFYFITKPLFLAMDWIFHKVGNFGVAILIVTVLIKILFFPLANKSYASMAKMKAVQPQMMAIRDRYADDKMKQQQAMMELYKQEKINPIAGCLPILIQIPVFFALYKVLFVTIEMRHAPFFGWIKDLSAPDPTTIFNLFGLLPWDPSVVPVLGPFLMLGVWPLIMGVTMWLQMKLNPPPPDPTQKMIFDWMPIIFTFMLASFPAGLVIYWAWNNALSVTQQSFIMHRHGAKIELFDNLKAMVAKKKKAEGGPAE